jgi:ABC-type multidrug transport system ATPase subunit
VLRGVAAAVGAGESVLVTGRNGAGKSTLLQVVAGLLPTSRGSVLNRPSVVGWVPERFPVRQPFTARSYLEGVARVRGIGGTEARAAIDRWVDRLDLGPSINTRLAELSKGSAQKVNLAQALLVRPSLLVMDEPWEGLDAQARRELPLIIADVADAGGTCVFSDHRGEGGELPGVRRWYLDDGLLTEPDTSESGNHVIEVVVPAADSAATVAKLRADGHEVRTVRREQVLKPTTLKRAAGKPARPAPEPKSDGELAAHGKPAQGKAPQSKAEAAS